MEQKTGSARSQQIVQKLQALKSRLSSDKQAQTELDQVIQEVQQQVSETSSGRSNE
jgi:CII-binding regulator of phage lambda lysogenization HflD